MGTDYQEKIMHKNNLRKKLSTTNPQTARHFVEYQREVGKGKITAGTNFEELTLRALAFLRHFAHIRRRVNAQKRELFEIRCDG